MSDIDTQLADPEFLAVIDDIVQTVMTHRVNDGHVPANGPEFEEERGRLAVEVLTVLLKA
jgi:hypothetical protein